jgi:hypothetical protein
VFKAIISRDNGEPWGNTGMSSSKWLHQPTRTFRIADLIATQPAILLHALTENGAPIGADKYPHVIQWQGNTYLEDGHHRVVRAAINGERTITARVLEVTA